MTDQLKTAMSDYPDELRVVMERAGWWISHLGSWAREGNDEDMDRRELFAISQQGKDEITVGYYASDNDAIVAAITWLMARSGHGEWDRYLSNGMEKWYGGRRVVMRDEPLLMRLLMAVNEQMPKQKESTR